MRELNSQAEKHAGSWRCNTPAMTAGLLPLSLAKFVYRVVIYTRSPCKILILDYYLQLDTFTRMHFLLTPFLPFTPSWLIFTKSIRCQRRLIRGKKRSKFLTKTKTRRWKRSFQINIRSRTRAGAWRGAAASSLPPGSLIDSTMCCPGRSAQFTGGGVPPLNSRRQSRGGAFCGGGVCEG